MAKKRTYRFCFGPWNISEGQDPYGPPVRPPQTFDWKLAQLKKLGFDAMMFHDDDEFFKLRDRKSTRLNSSHLVISYAVFCLKKKKQNLVAASPTSSYCTIARPP